MIIKLFAQIWNAYWDNWKITNEVTLEVQNDHQPQRRTKSDVLIMVDQSLERA
jgi:hypothetical protein